MIKTKSVKSPIEPRADGLRILAARFRGRGMPSSRSQILAMAATGHQPTDETPEGATMKKALAYVLKPENQDAQGFLGLFLAGTAAGTARVPPRRIQRRAAHA